jgi:biotin-(acetyl-CoA carboxylase) ligase
LPQSLASGVVFVQYLFALAVVEAVRSRPGYEDVPLRIKWPNDLYIQNRAGELKKVGGILVNSSFSGNQFTLVVGKRETATVFSPPSLLKLTVNRSTQAAE